MSELPKGWVHAPIQNVLRVLESGNIIDQGWSPKCEDFPSFDETTWGALKTTAIQDGRFEQEHTKQLPSALTPRPHLEVCEGDLLMTCAGPRVRCGVICQVEQVRRKLFISGKMYRFKADERIASSQFILAVLRSRDLQQAIDGIKTGGSDSGLNLTQDRFKGLIVPLAPLPEQKRIVAKLDTLNAKSVRARAELARIETLVSRYKQAVLDLLCDVSHSTVSLRDLVDQDRGIPYGIVQTGKPVMDGVPTVRCGDIKNYTIRKTELKLVDRQIAHQYGRTELVGGEVLIAIRGSIGETCFAGNDMAGCNISREVAMIPLLPGTSPQFVMYFLKSNKAKEFIGANTKGSAQQGINLGDLRNLPIPALNLQEQHEIVRRIESAFAKIDRLAKEAERALELVGRLDEAILAKAFRGELVPQDENDEPAERLLARIRAERQAAPRTKRGRGAKA